ncbi:MAG: putative baseplate assembly protein, partial [Nodularia sp. (in: cyanobacteria)]|nr:putative baseplate assembly protein [Nodularia sp. (in: cyanobacteria)]
SEVCVIKTPLNDQLQPILTLTKALENSYDPATTVIYANVISATHGETIEEVLGSGDGTLSNQRFILNKPPLTYISATTPNGAKTTLELFVDGVRWQEVPSLYGLNHLDQNYITRIDDDGTTTITFGDGEKGARLPSGLENLIARYRSGIGLAGEVAQDSLSLLKTRPLGIREVTNPVPATGAAAREALNEARTSAPLTVRTLDRIVSLQDFEDFSRAFSGIGKAKAEVIPNDALPIVYITIAAVNGKAVTPDSQLYTNLVQAIADSRAPEQIDVQIGSYQPLLFNLEAKILIDSRREVKPVLAEIRTALQETFSFERRSFGQSVTTSEAIAAIQNITGVIAVDLDALYLSSRPKTLESSLAAATATWDERQSKILPAQLLLLNPKGIILVNNP